MPKVQRITYAISAQSGATTSCAMPEYYMAGRVAGTTPPLTTWSYILSIQSAASPPERIPCGPTAILFCFIFYNYYSKFFYNLQVFNRMPCRILTYISALWRNDLRYTNATLLKRAGRGIRNLLFCLEGRHNIHYTIPTNKSE